MALSSKRLGVPTFHPGGNAAVVIYTVPAGKSAILRDARMRRSGGVAGRVVLYVDPVAGDTVALQASANLGTDVMLTLLDGFVVLEAGDSVGVFAGGGVVEVILSGHEFG